MFCTQTIAFSLDFCETDWQIRMNLFACQINGPLPNHRSKQDHDENRHENAKNENKRVLNHGSVTKKKGQSLSDWRLFIEQCAHSLLETIEQNAKICNQNGFHVGVAESFKYPILTPNRAPTPVRIGTNIIFWRLRTLNPAPAMT